VSRDSRTRRSTCATTPAWPWAPWTSAACRREVCLAYVSDEVRPGDYVVVHVGFAISKVDEEEARRTFELLREMSQLDELEWMGSSRSGATGRRDDGSTIGGG
jgi:hydrogenase assembly chaperone HypC/HupF